MSHQASERDNHADCDHAGVHQLLGRQVAQYQLQHWVLSRLLTHSIALREKRTSPTTRRPPPPRHVCGRHDDRESDTQDGPVLTTPTQEQIDELKSKIDEAARQLEVAEEQHRVFRTQTGSHCNPPESVWKLPPWRDIIGLEELPDDNNLMPCMRFILRAKRFLVNQGRIDETDDDGYNHLIWNFRAMEAGLINETQFILAIINICKDQPMTLILGMKSFLPPGLAVNILGPDDVMKQLPTIKMISWSNTLKSTVTFGLQMRDGSALQVCIEPDEHRMEQFRDDEEEEGEDDHAPFPQAIIDNDIATVRGFIESGIDLETRYGTVHKTALMIAASYNRHEIVDILIKGGANLYSRDDNGEIAFFWASWNNCVESLRVLHLAGCDLDDRDTRVVDQHNGLSTALYKAASNGKFKSVRYLVESGADIMCANNFGTPPHTKASAQGHPIILDYLLSREGVEVDHRNAAGVTALHMAAQWGELACLDVCLDYKANVEVEDRNGWTALFCAAWKGRYACVRRLVEHGHANLNHISHREQCGPLLVSVWSNNVETVAYLIDEAGCDIHEVDAEGDNILHCAAAFGANRVVDYLFENHRDEVQTLLESRNNDDKIPEEKARQEDEEETAVLLAGYRVHPSADKS